MNNEEDFVVKQTGQNNHNKNKVTNSKVKSARPMSDRDRQLEVVKQELADITEALKRERADAINLRRRLEEEKLSLGSFHKANIIRELLPVVDNFERSLKHIPKEQEDSDLAKGVVAILKQFEVVFGKIGVERIKTVGEEFDPELHEAVSMEDNGGSKEIVSEELQSGYRLADQVIRHAMVKVKN